MNKFTVCLEWWIFKFNKEYEAQEIVKIIIDLSCLLEDFCIGSK